MQNVRMKVKYVYFKILEHKYIVKWMNGLAIQLLHDQFNT